MSGGWWPKWNERQAQRAPLLFSRTIGAAIAAQHWFLSVRCPGCSPRNRSTCAGSNRYPETTVTGLIPAPSCRNCRPHLPFAEVVRLSPTSTDSEMREVRRRRVLGDYAARHRGG